MGHRVRFVFAQHGTVVCLWLSAAAALGVFPDVQRGQCADGPAVARGGERDTVVFSGLSRRNAGLEKYFAPQEAIPGAVSTGGGLCVLAWCLASSGVDAVP